MAGLRQELWSKDIKNVLYPNNEFYMKAINEGALAQDGAAAINRAQSGGPPTVVKDATVFPITATQRTDIAIQYPISAFYSTPTLILDIDEIETSYDKRQSVIADHTGAIITSIANWVNYNWIEGLTAARIVRTTGASRAATAPGATGTRKRLVSQNIIDALAIVHKDNVPGPVNILLPVDMYQDLHTEGFVQSWDKMGKPGLASGAIDMILGANVYMRSNTTIFNNAGTPVAKLPTDAAAATDNLSALIWKEQAVGIAPNQIKVYADPDKAEYFGSIFSMMARCGSSRFYSTPKGVAAIVEAP